MIAIWRAIYETKAHCRHFRSRNAGACSSEPTTYSPAQLKALAQAEFELNRISLMAAAEKAVNTSPLFKRYRLDANVTSDAQKQSEPKSTTTALQISGAK